MEFTFVLLSIVSVNKSVKFHILFIKMKFNYLLKQLKKKVKKDKSIYLRGMCILFGVVNLI